MAKTPGQPKNAENSLVVIPRNKVGKKCSICFHLEVNRINKLIRNGDSLRAISCQIVSNDSMRESIRRHTENCLKLDLRAMLEEKRIDQAVEHYKELIKLLNFSKELQSALGVLLRDTLTGQITFAPRDHEIEVLYVDYADLDPLLGLPKRKKEKLSDIIQSVSTHRSGFAYQTAQIKSINYFDASLQIVKTIDLLLDKFAKVDGHYQKERENDETLKRVAKAFVSWAKAHTEIKEKDYPHWVEQFARNSGVDLKQLADKVGVEVD